MIQKLDTSIYELDVVALVHDIPLHHLKQGDRGAVVHYYADGQAFEVEFIHPNGQTLALLTLTHADIQKVESHQPLTPVDSHPMSDAPEIQMNFNAPVTGAAGKVEGDLIVNAQEQNLAEAAAEIQQLLNQLAQTYPNETERQVEVVKRAAKRNPTFKKRLLEAAKAGGVEDVKQILDYVFKNPIANIVAETIKAFVEAA